MAKFQDRDIEVQTSVVLFRLLSNYTFGKSMNNLFSHQYIKYYHCLKNDEKFLKIPSEHRRE